MLAGKSQRHRCQTSLRDPFSVEDQFKQHLTIYVIHKKCSKIESWQFKEELSEDDVIYGWKVKRNISTPAPPFLHKWPRKKISCLMRFQSTELHRMWQDCTNMWLLQITNRNVRYSPARESCTLSIFQCLPLKTTWQGHRQFRVNDAWFDSCVQAAGLSPSSYLSLSTAPFSYFGMKRLPWTQKDVTQRRGHTSQHKQKRYAAYCCGLHHCWFVWISEYRRPVCESHSGFIGC